MRLSDYIVCVLIYCNLPGLLHRNGWIEVKCNSEGIRAVTSKIQKVVIEAKEKVENK